ncbi:MAG: hypothetical protein L0154_03475 [Chloroflexi bacterium]|nr:hypothetical protein [Chloroflexota bacterium]
MKRLLILLSLILLPVNPGQAQDNLTPAFIAITFEEVSAGNPCLLAVGAYAGFFGGDVGDSPLPIVNENGDCAFAAGTSLRIRMGRTASSYLIFNSGSMTIDLWLRGAAVLSESTNGAESMNREAEFDEILFTATGEAVISDISLSFAVERLASDSFTFDGAAEGSPCLEGLAWAFLSEFSGDAVIATTSDTGLGAPECSIPPNSVLSFSLGTPASLIEFASSGAALVNLYMDGHPVQPPASIMGAGGYFATSIVGFNEVRILAGETGVRLDNLALEYPTLDFAQYVSFPEVGADCAAFLDGRPNINAARLSTSQFPAPIIEASTCTLNPGNELTLSFERPVVTFGFWSTGGGVIEAYRGGAAVRPADVVR